MTGWTSTSTAQRRGRRPARELLLLAGAAIALQAMTWSLLLALYTSRVWYGLHDLSDSPYYLEIAVRVAYGRWPYVDFPFEYPPLALPFFLLPPAGGTVATYDFWFSVEMIAMCMASAVVVALVAARVWGGLGRPLGAAAAFAAAVIAAGAISVNRFDPAVGLIIVLCVLALAYRRFTLAGVAVGLGFALKLVPIVLLPLVLVLAARRGPMLRAAAAAAVAAAIPFVPFLVRSWGAFNGAFAGQTARGLHIESVPATPYLVWRALSQGAGVVIVPPQRVTGHRRSRHAPPRAPRAAHRARPAGHRLCGHLARARSFAPIPSGSRRRRSPCCWRSCAATRCSLRSTSCGYSRLSPSASWQSQ